MHQNYPL